MQIKKARWGTVLFSAVEVFIGSFTLFSVTLNLILGKSAKPTQVLIFVLVTSVISFILGIGILKRNLTSYYLLLYFASLIILSKILIFAKIISLSGALETAVPAVIKNLISITYHSLLIWYFLVPSVRKEFNGRI